MKTNTHIPDKVRREIEVRAYLIWEGEGRPHGREKEHWHRAEAEILGTPPAKKATRAQANGTAKGAAAEKPEKKAVPADKKPAGPEKTKRSAASKPSKNA